MKILLVDQYREIGGGQTVLLQVLRALVSAGAEAQVAIPLGGGLERSIRTEFGNSVRLHETPELKITSGHKTPGDLLRLLLHSFSFLKIRRILKDVDVVYVNGPRLFPSFLALSSVYRARFIYHLHLDYSFAEKLLISALLKHPRTEAVLTCSKYVFERFQASVGSLGSNAKLRLLENALSSAFSGLPFEDRWNEPKLQAVIPGRIIPEKGQAMIVDLAAELSGIMFHFLGDADFGSRDYLEKLKSQAPGNVYFHGHVPDLKEAISKIGAQISLIPSQWEEPFGLTAIESMACSCLTIVSKRGGLKEIAGRTGAWVCDSKEDWKNALRDVQSSSPESLRAQAKAQHENALKNYSKERFAREVREVFQISTQATAHMS